MRRIAGIAVVLGLAGLLGQARASDPSAMGRDDGEGVLEIDETAAALDQLRQGRPFSFGGFTLSAHRVEGELLHDVVLERLATKTTRKATLHAKVATLRFCNSSGKQSLIMEMKETVPCMMCGVGVVPKDHVLKLRIP